MRQVETHWDGLNGLGGNGPSCLLIVPGGESFIAVHLIVVDPLCAPAPAAGLDGGVPHPAAATHHGGVLLYARSVRHPAVCTVCKTMYISPPLSSQSSGKILP